MSKVIGMLVALAMFCAMPALAFAQDESENVSSGNTQDADIDQDGDGGGNAVGGEGEDGSGGDAAGGEGNVGNQAAICQQNAGEDAECDIDQSQRFGGDTFVDVNGDGVDDDNGHARRHGVHSVTLARTGFDAWILALIGGIVVAGGVAMLVTQRRGRLHS